MMGFARALKNHVISRYGFLGISSKHTVHTVHNQKLNLRTKDGGGFR